MQEAVEGAKAIGGPLGSFSGRGLPQVERIRLNVHANQVGVTAGSMAVGTPQHTPALGWIGGVRSRPLTTD